MPKWRATIKIDDVKMPEDKYVQREKEADLNDGEEYQEPEYDRVSPANMMVHCHFSL